MNTKPSPIKATARFVRKIQLSQTVWEFTFEMIEPKQVNYLAGQYIVLEITPSEKRQYSISTSPLLSKTQFQTLVDLKPQGLGTKYLQSLAESDEIKFIGQIGNFILPEKLKDNLFFVSTGSGLSPLKSMIETLIFSDEYKCRKINLLFGSYSQPLYKELFDKYVSDGKINSYRIFLSDEGTVETGNVFKGWVTRGLENLDPETIKASQFFLCGNLDMIRNVQELLIKKGAFEEDIHHEKFY